MRKILLSLTGFLVLSGQPLASYGQDLLETYAQALAADPTLANAKATQMANREQLPQAVSQLLPNVTATGNFTNEQYPPSIYLDSNPIQPSYYYLLNLQQNLINLAAWYGVKQAKDVAKQADATYMASEQDLMQRVSQAYFNVLSAQDTLAFIRAQKEAVGRQLDQTQQQFEVGLVAITDVSEAQASYDSTVADEIEAVNQLSNQREALRQITGIWPEYLSPLKGEIPLVNPVPATDQEWVDTALEYNPTLKASNYNMEATAQAANVARANYAPTVTLASNYGYERLGTFATAQSPLDETWMVGVNVNLSIYQGGYTSSQVRQNQYLFQAAKDTLEKTRREVLSNTRNAFRAVQTSVSEVNALNQSVVSGVKALESTQAAYDVGTRTSVDLLNSISTLYQRKQNYSQSRYTYLVSQLQLKQAVGTLNYNDLAVINSLLSTKKPTDNSTDNLLTEEPIE